MSRLIEHILRHLSLALISVGLLTTVGCVKALHPYVKTVKLRVQSDFHPQYELRLANSTEQIFATNGCLTFDVRTPSRGCATYLFGLKISDDAMYTKKILYINRDGKTLRRLSIGNISRLPIDKDGFSQLRIE